MKLIHVLCLSLILCSCVQPTTRRPTTYTHNMESIRRAHIKEKIKRDIDQEKRVQTINHRLAKSTGEELCDRKLKASTGIFLTQIKSKGFFMSKGDKEAIDDQIFIHGQPEKTVFVDFVVEGSPADKAGIRSGDKLVSIYGIMTSTGDDALKKTTEIIQRYNKDDQEVEVEIERKNKSMSFNLKPDMICPYPVIIDKTAPEINAYANGELIVLNQPLIDYLSDNELAAVIGHELAHNTMGHINAKEMNIAGGMMLGLFLDVVTDNQSATYSSGGAIYGHLAFSKEFEDEADYVMTYYMARAGFDYHKAKNVWKTMAARNYRSLYSKGDTHPMPQERYALIAETAREIDTKKAFNEPITPDFGSINKWLKDKKELK